MITLNKLQDACRDKNQTISNGYNYFFDRFRTIRGNIPLAQCHNLTIQIDKSKISQTKSMMLDPKMNLLHLF